MMLKEKQMQEIQDLKLRGYSMNEIVRYYEEKGQKPPSLPTIRKYYQMDAVPEVPNQNLIKDKAFDHEPYRTAIIEIIRNNNKSSYCVSSIHDVLIEKFIENGTTVSLPGNEQTLRNYIHYLTSSGIIENEPENRRIYDHVFDTPPGEQMLIDFGQEHVAPGIDIHFICLLLRYSRLISVFAQDHKYNSEEACRAIYRAFCKLGGRPEQLVIDQDAVFVASETYGEVVEARTFGDFCTEQDLKLWVCNKADPESKGPIENVVGFVKKNFFSARNITCIDDVWKSLPGWVERKNQRIHKATFRIPNDVFNTIEKEALRPLVPSFYENSPSSFMPVDLNSVPYVQFKSSRYSVPRTCCFTTVYYKAIGSKLFIYSQDRKHICTHTISECRGSVNQLEEHRKEPSGDWISVMESLRRKWNCYSFQHFINGFKKENPRHLCQQLAAVERFLDAEKAERELVSQVMDECCRNYRYRFSQFKVVYQLEKAGRMSAPVFEFNEVQRQDMEVYKKAFQNRCEQQEVIA
jgi:hypothetical protein